MLTNVFLIIELTLRVFGLWGSFLDYLDKKRIAEEEQRRQDRDKAVDDATKAKTPDEAFDAENRVVSNDP